MEEIFTVRKKTYAGETQVVSARLPRELVEEIDKVAKATRRSRNEILEKCIVYAINRVEIEES